MEWWIGPLSIAITKLVLGLARMDSKVEFVHCPGHTGHKRNAYVEAVARPFHDDICVPAFLPFHSWQLAKPTPHRISWASSLMCGRVDGAACPPVANSYMVITSSNELEREPCMADDTNDQHSKSGSNTMCSYDDGLLHVDLEIAQSTR